MELNDYTNLRPNEHKSLLLLPLLEDNLDNSKKWFKHGLIDIYYKDTNKPHWGEKIILLYDARKIDIHPILNWNKSPYKYETYEEYYEGKLYRIFAYVIPPKYKKDFELMKTGNYSKISTSTKTHIIDFYKTIDPKSLSYTNTVRNILRPPIMVTLNKKREYTDAFGEKQILNINQVHL